MFEPDQPQSEDSTADEATANRRRSTFVYMLSRTRLVILFGAFASLLASVVLLVESLLSVIKTSWDSIIHGDFGQTGIEHLSVDFLGLIDSILLGTVLYIIALGLYELFFDPDLPVPEWLHFRNLTQLKEALIEVILVLLGVTFVGHAVAWTGGRDILGFGLSVAAVIVALGLILLVGHIRIHGDRDG